MISETIVNVTYPGGGIIDIEFSGSSILGYTAEQIDMEIAALEKTMLRLYLLSIFKARSSNYSDPTVINGAVIEFNPESALNPFAVDLPELE